MDTKERILITALHLFAKDGYEAVSVSMIAKELGITKGALYRHYENKRDIFDSIVKRMFELDTEMAKESEVPEHIYEKKPEEYKVVTIEQVKEFTRGQLIFWTEDDFASNFRKMLTLEQYRNEEMGKLHSDCILSGPISYMEDIFREMIEKRIIKKAEPKELAVRYYAPLYLLIQVCDREHDKSQMIQLLDQHIDSFFEEFKE